MGPIVPTQTVGSKFLRYAPEFASASMHLLARILHIRAIFVLKTAKEILTDTLFIERLETYRRRHFANLATPDMPNIAVDILRMIEGLFR